jgi:hypothetical protein
MIRKLVGRPNRDPQEGARCARVESPSMPRQMRQADLMPAQGGGTRADASRTAEPLITAARPVGRAPVAPVSSSPELRLQRGTAGRKRQGGDRSPRPPPSLRSGAPPCRLAPRGSGPRPVPGSPGPTREPAQNGPNNEGRKMSSTEEVHLIREVAICYAGCAKARGARRRRLPRRRRATSAVASTTTREHFLAFYLDGRHRRLPSAIAARRLARASGWRARRAGERSSAAPRRCTTPRAGMMASEIAVRTTLARLSSVPLGTRGEAGRHDDVRPN